MNWVDVVYESLQVAERESRKDAMLERIAVALEMYPEAIKNTRKNKISNWKNGLWVL